LALVPAQTGVYPFRPETAAAILEGGNARTGSRDGWGGEIEGEIEGLFE